MRLLVSTSVSARSTCPTITLLGVPYALVDLDPSEVADAGYACVSYAWGKGRVQSSLDPRMEMSDRTLQAAETLVASGIQGPIWIDGLCVPVEEPARTSCLLSMGAIYSRAAVVVVVLSAACAPLLRRVQAKQQVEEAALLAFEADDWVARAWTYQEVVNSGTLRFVSEGDSDASRGDPARATVEGRDVLNAVGKAISDYRKTRELDAFEFRVRHRRLDGLEDLIADWETAAFLDRSAYQVMSAMHSRTAERAGDGLFAMIGAVAASFVPPSDASVEPSEHFMRHCESKGDFSFIYASAPRSPEPARSWRPAQGALRVVLPWHTTGTGQSGGIHPAGLRLHAMHRLTPGAPSPEAIGFVQQWLHREGLPRGAEMHQRIHDRLRQAGFTGGGEPLEFAEGFFFPQTPPPAVGRPIAIVATQLRWVHGAPGLVLREGGPNDYRCCGAGAFVGIVPAQGAPFEIG